MDRDDSTACSATESRGSIVLPRAVVGFGLHVVRGIAGYAIGLGVSADAVTVASLALSLVGGALLATGSFGWAWLAMTIAFLGDALDGAIARGTGRASVSGALLDASVDRYGEALVIGGLAVHLRASAWALALCIAALAGAFMVSYGSAKAEAIGARVPPGAMRRLERAVLLCLGVGLSALLATRVPVLVALGLLALVGNASAVRRLYALGHVCDSHPVLRALGIFPGTPGEIPTAETKSGPNTGENRARSRMVRPLLDGLDRGSGVRPMRQVQRVLVVDDGPAMSEMIADDLCDRGYDGVAVTSGPEALRRLQSEHFDLLVTDLRMPDIDGLMLLRASLRIDPKRPVILLTAHGTVETAVKATCGGAYHYLTKPFRLEVLSRLIQEALAVQ